MVTINISKKDLYLISAIFVFLIGVGFVIATNSGNSNINGHSNDEIEMPGVLCGLVNYNDNNGWSYMAKCMGKWPYDNCPPGFTKTSLNINGGLDILTSCIKN